MTSQALTSAVLPTNTYNAHITHITDHPLLSHSQILAYC